MENTTDNIPEGFYRDPKTGALISKQCTCGKKNEQMDSCEECKALDLKKTSNSFGLTGWICPACGRGNSPFSTSCPCIPLPFNITYCK